MHKKNPIKVKAGSKGGKIGGKVSPTNFKNNPEKARAAGKKSALTRALRKLDLDLGV